MNVLPPAGPERRRQFVRVGVLAVVLAGALWYRFGRTPSAPSTSAPTERADVPAVAATLPEPVRLDALDTLPTRADGQRNPFMYGARQAPPSALPPVTSMPYNPGPVRPPQPQGPPPIPLRLAGLTVLPGSNRAMVTLSDPSTHGLYQGFEGDIVDGRYRIVKVGLQSVVVSYVDGSGSRTLSLGG